MGDAPDVQRAQRGTPLTEVYPPARVSAPVGRTKGGRSTIARARAVGASVGSRSAGTTARADTGLTGAERSAVIDAFVPLVEGLYAHLPLKRAMYAIDPLQRLLLLAQRAADMEDSEFNDELGKIVTRLRDAHTRYVGPTRLAGRVAALPFMVESYGAPSEASYIVSRVSSKRLVGDPKFEPGVDLLWWNGVPIDRAVDNHAEFETGGRPDSRRARALETLTLRSLQYGPPPDEHWVVVGYRDLRGTEREVKIPWRVVAPGRSPTGGGAGIASAHRYALDPGREGARRAKKLLFAPRAWRTERGAAAGSAPARSRRPSIGKWITSPLSDAVGAKRISTSWGELGYLRLWSFDVADDVSYVEEVIRLLAMLPDDGLIIDLRANPGGLIWAAERLLQLFSPCSISPTRFSILATPLTRAMARAGQNAVELGPWRASLEDALATGEPYSLPVPITPLALCNDIGQVYGGPVVAVVDANTYSAGDLFAAGFYDNGVGTLVTVGEATGAGGANVWWPDQVQAALLGTEFEQGALPGGISYSIAVRRATRGTGDAAGAPIEDVGVRGHRPYVMTKDDLTGDNQDMLDFCGEILAGSPSSSLDVSEVVQGAASVRVDTRGLDRLDFFLDGRPGGSSDVADGGTTLGLPPGWQELELRGYVDGALRQMRRLPPPTGSGT